jgi:hypothetical protein
MADTNEKRRALDLQRPMIALIKCRSAETAVLRQLDLCKAAFALSYSSL